MFTNLIGLPYWCTALHTMQTFTEVSESDACTSYHVTPVWSGETATCQVMIADSPVYGRMLFLDGELQSAAADERIYHESLVHPAMAVASMRKKDRLQVLVIGGGEGATVREVLRWNPTRVDWVDIDGELVTLCREHLGWAPDVYADPRVHYWPEDIEKAWAYLYGEYDVIILDLPDPDGDTGYLYSSVFWQNVRLHRSPGAVVVTHVGPVRPYGSLGEGAQRIAKEFRGLHEGGFYQTTIPSFQGSWGFWLYAGDGVNPFDILRPTLSMPFELEFVDEPQMQQWASPSVGWRREVARIMPRT